jgi:hypothetical protein
MGISAGRAASRLRIPSSCRAIIQAHLPLVHPALFAEAAQVAVILVITVALLDVPGPTVQPDFIKSDLNSIAWVFVLKLIDHQIAWHGKQLLKFITDRAG